MPASRRLTAGPSGGAGSMPANSQIAAPESVEVGRRPPPEIGVRVEPQSVTRLEMVEVPADARPPSNVGRRLPQNFRLHHRDRHRHRPHGPADHASAPADGVGQVQLREALEQAAQCDARFESCRARRRDNGAVPIRIRSAGWGHGSRRTSPGRRTPRDRDSRRGSRDTRCRARRCRHHTTNDPRWPCAPSASPGPSNRMSSSTATGQQRRDRRPGALAPPRARAARTCRWRAGRSSSRGRRTAAACTRRPAPARTDRRRRSPRRAR